MKEIIEKLGLPATLTALGPQTGGLDSFEKLRAKHGVTRRTNTYTEKVDDSDERFIEDILYGPMADGSWMIAGLRKHYRLPHFILGIDIVHSYDPRECRHLDECGRGGCDYLDEEDEWEDDACAYCVQGSDFCTSHNSYH